MALSEYTASLFRKSGAIVLSDAISSPSLIPCFPFDQLTFPDDLGFMDNIGITGSSLMEQGNHSVVQVNLLVATELEFCIPGLQGFALRIGNSTSKGAEITVELDTAPNYYELRIMGDMSLRFARNMLKPMRQGANGWEEVTDGHSEIKITGTLSIDGDGDISASSKGVLSLNHPSMIADSGVILEAEDIKLVLSSKVALPDNRPMEITTGWRGVFVKRAAVHF